MQTLLKGGTVVSGTGMHRADVRIDGEKIVQVGRKLDGGEAQVIDVTGCLLFPGFIDAHPHFDLDVAGTTTADDFYTGSRAGRRGGPPPAAARGLAALRTLVHVVGRGGIHPSRAPAHSCNILRAASIPPMRTGSYLRVPSSLKWFFKAFSVG